MFEEQAFDPERHDRAGFSCGVPELDDHLHRLATQHRRKSVSTVHVLVDTGAPNLILGYYTLSAAQVDTAELSDADRKKLPRYPAPRFRMGPRFDEPKHRSVDPAAVCVDWCVRSHTWQPTFPWTRT